MLLWEKTREATANSVREVLRDSFKNDLRAAARAHAAFESWSRSIPEGGPQPPITPEVEKWWRFRDKWSEFVWADITRPFARFDDVTGIDFSKALKLERTQKRGRGRSL